MNFDTVTALLRRLTSELDNPLQLAIELLLIGVSVNWCANVLHGTRGTRLLRGLLVLLIAATLGVQFFASALHWERLQLLYRFFVIGLGFIALVAFQPELRRALIRAGDVGFRRRSTPRERVIGALVEAAGYLSRNRFGALIALQRNVGLGNWTEHGVQMNAEISADLLKAIFYPKAPLHDLGVVISGSRILAANCQFPVAESGDVELALGSRHRAGIGLSSETDALILIVSEETGTISIADHGQLIRYLALDDLDDELRTRLADFADQQDGRPRSFRSRTWRSLRRLLVVAPLTLVIWFLADQAGLVRADDLRVAVRIQADPEIDISLLEPAAPLFGLAVRGPKVEVDKLRRPDGSPEQFTWTLRDTPDPGEYGFSGERLTEIFQQMVDARGVRLAVERVKPENVRIGIDRLKRVRLPVVLATGPRRVADVVIEPAEVEVVLREGDLDRILPDELRIKADIAARLVDTPPGQTVRFARLALDSTIGGVGTRLISPPEVAVSLTVVAEQARRRFERVPVQLAVAPQVFEAFRFTTPNRLEWLVAIEVEGEAAAIERLTLDQIVALVQVPPSTVVAGDRPETFEVDVNLPAGIRLVGPPPTVQLQLYTVSPVTP